MQRNMLTPTSDSLTNSIQEEIKQAHNTFISHAPNTELGRQQFKQKSKKSMLLHNLTIPPRIPQLPQVATPTVPTQTLPPPRALTLLPPKPPRTMMQPRKLPLLKPIPQKAITSPIIPQTNTITAPITQKRTTPPTEVIRPQSPQRTISDVLEDFRQTKHFKASYEEMTRDEIPPLIQYQPPIPARVAVLPSNIKRSPIIYNQEHTMTTLTKKLEPPSTYKKPASHNVFSGPHYVPEKYSPKVVADFRQTYFNPQYNQPSQTSRYFTLPNINQYFQAALQDGSYFESYTQYNPSDPINFRHAYGGHSLDEQRPKPGKIIHDQLSTPPQPPKRKWHKPVQRYVSSSSSMSDDDDDDDIREIIAPKTPVQEEIVKEEQSYEGEQEDEGDVEYEEDEEDDDDVVLVSAPSTAVICQTRSSKKIKGKEKDVTVSQKRFTPPTSLFSDQQSQPATKKLKLNTSSIIPTKKEAIEELRHLGKFIKSWKHKDAEVCCICYEDITTESNPIVYCDNALCEVIVHKSCYRIKHIPENWYCDRCIPDQKGISTYRKVTCAMCPSITGAFCKLSEPFHGIKWVHMICAKMLTGPNGFIQQKNNDYKMLIRNHIPIQRFLSKCIYCEDAMFAEFGAKLKCQVCPKSFHVTCAERTGHWCFNTNAILACSTHALYTTTKTSPKKLSLAFEKWISKREHFFEEQFELPSRTAKLDAWKVVKYDHVNGDAMDKTYKTFFDRLQREINASKLKQYRKYIDYLFKEFCKNYSSSYLLAIQGLFLKKNFYHGDIHAYKPKLDSFPTCFDDLDSSSQSMSPIPTPTESKKLTPRSSNEARIVVPSPDLICFICNQHKFPQETFDKFHFEENYLQHLEETKDQRKAGHTGTGNSWDPRVFIECAECRLKVHCGCPSPPIKKYPQKFQSFICIYCDRKGEETNNATSSLTRRGKVNINYKV